MTYCKDTTPVPEHLEILRKFAREPGRCSLYEVQRVEVFLKEFKARLADFRDAFGMDPIGKTVESKLDEAAWYTDFIFKKEKQ